MYSFAPGKVLGYLPIFQAYCLLFSNNLQLHLSAEVILDKAQMDAVRALLIVNWTGTIDMVHTILSPILLYWSNISIEENHSRLTEIECSNWAFRKEKIVAAHLIKKKRVSGGIKLQTDRILQQVVDECIVSYNMEES